MQSFIYSNVLMFVNVMPFLKDRAKHGKGRKPFGSRVSSVRKVRKLGKGAEGRVFEVEVTVKRFGRKRKLVLAEKHFRVFRIWLNKLVGFYYLPKPFGNPKEQFEIISKLIELNREKKLGLRLPATLRIRKRIFRHPTLVMTLFENIMPFKQLTDSQRSEFLHDRRRQIDILEKRGYFSPLARGLEWLDVFFPQVDGKTGKCVAVVGDFGAIDELLKK